ncbi:transmembrane 177-like [Paramuricea clavata]|uniref:Transmembrane 177-like n=1 Tax=Paramuricea clavata TaxID=317549 RepID=A0A6S7HMY3_PARCT|nr:transmembrane 177-like [Paramuricea clavata]
MSRSKLVHGIVAATSTVLVLVHSVPNLYPNFVVNHQGFKNVDIPCHIEQAFEEVAKKMNLSHSEKVKLFINNGCSSVSVGSTWLPGGAAIGISRLYLYTDLEQLSESGLVFKGKKLNLDSKAGKKLSKALLFNDEELKFILAHEVSHLQNLDFTTNCFLPAWWLYFTYRAIPIILANLPPNSLLKIAVQGSLWLSSYWIFSRQNTTLHHNREFAADQNAAMLGVTYVKGGINATMKRMKVNETLRGLNRQDGKNLYSIEGNDLKDWAHPKLSERLRKLEEIYVEKYLGDKTT